MAKLRAVFRDYSFEDREIADGTQYDAAKTWLQTQPHIWYFYYWSDQDLGKGQFYTYPIEKEDLCYAR